MPSGRAALFWGLCLSLALHATWLGSAPRARPHRKRAAPAQTLELALVHLPARTHEVTETQSSPPTAAGAKLAAPGGSARRAPRLRARALEAVTASAAPPLPAADEAGRDLGALERTLKRIAATTELSPDQRRKAMLVVLRTWEDPSRNERAEQLIETLLRELHPGQD